jgi:hypothetical protein
MKPSETPTFEALLEAAAERGATKALEQFFQSQPPPQAAPEKRFLTREEFAQVIGVNPDWVSQMKSTGALPESCIRMVGAGRYRIDMETWANLPEAARKRPVGRRIYES